MIMQQPTSGPVPVSKLVPVQPLNREFNIAVHHIANRLNPRGWIVSEGGLASLAALTAHMTRWGILLIDSDHSDHTIFADPETNYAFRAWHDWHHWKLQAPFDMAGEIAVANSQAGDLIALYGAARSRPWRDLLRAEVVGQAEYEARHGVFPTDQIGFVQCYLLNGGMPRVSIFH